MPQDFWQKIGAAASTVVNSLLCVGQMIYKPGLLQTLYTATLA